MTTTRSRAENLREAATLIGQPDGWLRNFFCNGGQKLDDLTVSTAFCLTGALQKASGIERAATYFALAEYDLACRVLARSGRIVRAPEGVQIPGADYQGTDFYVPNLPSQTILAIWNNYVAKSADEVVEVLLAAAELAEAEEQEQAEFRAQLALTAETPVEEPALV